MANKDINNETVLFSERLGDEGKIRSILMEWGMEKAAIRRMLKEHRARHSGRPDHGGKFSPEKSHTPPGEEAQARAEPYGGTLR